MFKWIEYTYKGIKEFATLGDYIEIVILVILIVINLLFFYESYVSEKKKISFVKKVYKILANSNIIVSKEELISKGYSKEEAEKILKNTNKIKQDAKNILKE